MGWAAGRFEAPPGRAMISLLHRTRAEAAVRTELDSTAVCRSSGLFCTTRQTERGRRLEVAGGL